MKPVSSRSASVWCSRRNHPSSTQLNSLNRMSMVRAHLDFLVYLLLSISVFRVWLKVHSSNPTGPIIFVTQYPMIFSRRASGYFVMSRKSVRSYRRQPESETGVAGYAGCAESVHKKVIRISCFDFQQWNTNTIIFFLRDSSIISTNSTCSEGLKDMEETTKENNEWLNHKKIEVKAWLWLFLI